jgi:hypothetical protein
MTRADMMPEDVPAPGADERDVIDPTRPATEYQLGHDDIARDTRDRHG